MYHSIGNEGITDLGAERYAVSLENFRKQVEFIVRGQDLQITFDDGDVTNYKYAFPILKELKLSAYFFIIVSKIGSSGFMNWEQIKTLKNEGMIIGSHGMTHKILTGLNEGDLDYELRISKKVLEEQLRCDVNYFSIPRGFYNINVIEGVKNNGYKAVFTSNYKDHDGFKIGRIAIKADWDLEYFTKVINDGLSLKDKAKELIKNSSKMLLGTNNYDRLRTRILKK